MTRARKVILAIVLIFVAYAVLTSPVDSADIVRTAFGRLADGAAAIGTFFDRLLS